MERNDVRHYTPEEVALVLEAALDLTRQLELEEHMEAAVFTQAAAMLSAKTIQLAQPQPVMFGVPPAGFKVS